MKRWVMLVCLLGLAVSVRGDDGAGISAGSGITPGEPWVDDGSTTYTAGSEDVESRGDSPSFLLNPDSGTTAGIHMDPGGTPWWFGDANGQHWMRMRSDGVIELPNLINCDTLDTGPQGQLRCGVDGGGGGSPGGSGSQLQYRVDATTFGGVSSSSVSGASITLGGDLVFSGSGLDIRGTDTATGSETWGLHFDPEEFYIRNNKAGGPFGLDMWAADDSVHLGHPDFLPTYVQVHASRTGNAALVLPANSVSADEIDFAPMGSFTAGSEFSITSVALGLDNQNELRFYESNSSGDNYLAFKAPSAITSDSTCTLENDSNPIPDSCVGDGVDSGASAVAWDNIADPTTNGTIAFAGTVQLITSTLDDGTAGTEAVLEIDDSDADLANDTVLQRLQFSGDASDANAIWLTMEDSAGVQVEFAQDGITLNNITTFNFANTTALTFGTDPADAGEIRLENADVIAWEASPAGTDVTLTVNTSEQFVFDNDVVLSGTGPDIRWSPTSGDTFHMGAEYAAATGTIWFLSNQTDGNHFIAIDNNNNMYFPRITPAGYLLVGPATGNTGGKLYTQTTPIPASHGGTGTTPGTNPSLTLDGQLAIDTTDNQLLYFSREVRTLPYERTVCAIIEDLAATDDSYAFYMANDAITVTAVGCNCRGTCTTAATFTLEDRGGNAMTITGTNPTCATTGAATFAAVTAGGGLTAGEMVAFDVTNSPTADDEYALCISFTTDRQ